MNAEESLRIFRIIFDMIWQSLISMSCLVAWFIVLLRLLDSQTYFDTGKYIAIESCLSATIYFVFKYWFGSSKRIK
jgi:hypothetical protein